LKAIFKTLVLLSVLVLAACRPAPKADDVRDAVTAHFAQRGYQVVELSVQSIRPLSNREKTYMGVPAYVVELDRLVLNIKGQDQTFRGVHLMLKKQRLPATGYVVADISGVPLP